MSRLSRAEDIWILKPNREDLLTGATYAAISLPWTFNRMMKNTSSRGQCERGLNVAKGIVAQEVLRRELLQWDIPVEVERKSYRDEDLFDFRLPIAGSSVTLDVKSCNHYNNYPGDERPPLSRELIIENKSYGGPDWRRFFPLLVPHTQIDQHKEGYCFAIATSIDFRRNGTDGRSCSRFTAFPFGEHLNFLSSPRLCQARESAGKGFYLDVAYESGGTWVEASEIEVRLIGEYKGEGRELIALIGKGTTLRMGPFSCLSSIQIDEASYREFYGRLSVDVGENEFDAIIRNSLRENVNVVPERPLIFTPMDFCNLVLPDDYTLHFIGWIPKQEYLSAVKQYTGWVWPWDKVNRFENQLWSTITENDLGLLSKLGLHDQLRQNPVYINAGLMKTTGKGNGACCYVFPNTYGGGLRETNLYVLPQDLYTMDQLVESCLSQLSS